MPIFVYRCATGHHFERLVPRDTAAPPCPECGTSTRKIPAGPSLRRATADPTPTAGRTSGSVPIPWRGVVSGGPEKMKRELEFRQRLTTKAASSLQTPGGPDPGREQPPGGRDSR
jgi:putative FmdB family regulatory protein